VDQAKRIHRGEHRSPYFLPDGGSALLDPPYICGGLTMADLADAAGTWLPPRFPETWASAWGEDEFGLWMALDYQGARQVFRWILPGTFLMGSPETEAQRLDRELQHEVTLTQGYWLADTACTQALWHALMGDNPSRFSDDSRNPVEQVSWDEVGKFIDALNQRIPNLRAGLPSEAQWEYACRAGTTTPFSRGKNITSEQVNYNGNYPYVGGKKGAFRERTVPVGSLPPNAWGLYEMHGNLWEWCADWYRDYSSDAQINPTGPDTGANRVLRGGSWINGGRNVRSAHRRRIVPGKRDHGFGFRLALGQRAGKGEAPAREPARDAWRKGRCGADITRLACRRAFSQFWFQLK
jgi:formylglycine-generating enzyme